MANGVIVLVDDDFEKKGVNVLAEKALAIHLENARGDDPDDPEEFLYDTVLELVEDTMNEGGKDTWKMACLLHYDKVDGAFFDLAFDDFVSDVYQRAIEMRDGNK